MEHGVSRRRCVTRFPSTQENNDRGPIACEPAPYLILHLVYACLRNSRISVYAKHDLSSGQIRNFSEFPDPDLPIRNFLCPFRYVYNTEALGVLTLCIRKWLTDQNVKKIDFVVYFKENETTLKKSEQSPNDLFRFI